MRRAFYYFIRGFSLTCVLFAGPAPAQMCIEPAVGMVAWWPGDGDSIDVHSGLHAAALNGASYGTGLVGEAFVFDGVGNGQDDRVDLPPSAIDGLSDLTFEMWVQLDSGSGAFFSGASEEIEGVHTDNEVLLFQYVDGTRAFIRESRTDLIQANVGDGSWHHLAYTRSGADGTFYVDGVAVDARTVSMDPIEIGPGGLMLGQEQDCLGGCFDPGQALDGRVDELAIYDRALSAAEIVAIFDAREAGRCKPSSREDLLREIDDLESDVDTLIDRIAELEAAAEEAEEAGDDCWEHGRDREKWRDPKHCKKHDWSYRHKNRSGWRRN